MRMPCWRAYLKNETWFQFYYPPKVHPLVRRDDKALPVLIYLANDANSRVQWSAIRLIGSHRERGAVAVPVLAKALRSHREEIRINALLAIKAIGPKASLAKSDVEKLLCGTEPEIAALAKETLRAIGSK